MNNTRRLFMTRDLELEMAQLEVKLLRAQFNSHFLFNNLSAINYRILNRNPADASKYLGVFSRLLRRTLADSRTDFTRLSEEIETLRLYVKMENMRFDRRVEFVVSIQPGVESELLQLPSMLLHSYMESAIWRSLRPGNETYTIRLTIVEKRGRYHVLVEDYGAAKTETKPHNNPAQQDLSLELVTERMRLLNERHGIDIRIEEANQEPETIGQQMHRAGISFLPFLIKERSQVIHY